MPLAGMSTAADWRPPTNSQWTAPLGTKIATPMFHGGLAAIGKARRVWTRTHSIGFEPITFGSVDGSIGSATTGAERDLRQSAEPAVPVNVPAPANGPSAAERAELTVCRIPDAESVQGERPGPMPLAIEDADLARVVAAWDRLPAAMKNAVLALIEAADR